MMEVGSLSGDAETHGANGTVTRKEIASLNDSSLPGNRSSLASSAFWGVTGDVPPREPHDVAGKKPHCFEMEINRKLVPFPEDRTSFPRMLDYSLVGLHRLREGSDHPPRLNASQMRSLMAGHPPSGDTLNSNKLPFLEKTSTQKRTIGIGEFGPEALDALHKADDDLTKAKNAREKLKNEPFKSTDPQPYRPTSWDYCDMSGIDPSSYWIKTDDQEGMPAIYKSRYNLVEKEGPVRRVKTMAMLEQGKNVNRGQLRNTLNGMNTEALPEGYKTWSAGNWMSTTHDAHAPYDIEGAAATNKRDAVVPLQRTYHLITPAHEETIVLQKQRHLSRHNGNWITEYSNSYVDRFDRAEVNKKFSKKSIFDIRDGIYTMHHYSHHPRDDTGTGETYTPSQIVPGQYTTMSQQPLHARNTI
ncbi:unnamed protein product [Trypanosoma congolense IL3000]|uniref:WGS project CAEQ00000000 data, annotated contig 823 n=1 Tax=Trypanosoma congolense (strain IL3000) TaxID=1068625 RepID=F9WIR1_TRYCI|nr:unnamed protein product [Trypanosoma congolense IL3000]